MCCPYLQVSCTLTQSFWYMAFSGDVSLSSKQNYLAARLFSFPFCFYPLALAWAVHYSFHSPGCGLFSFPLRSERQRAVSGLDGFSSCVLIFILRTVVVPSSMILYFSYCVFAVSCGLSFPCPTLLLFPFITHSTTPNIWCLFFLCSSTNYTPCSGKTNSLMVRWPTRST